MGDTITDFIKRLLAENAQLERENQEINARNAECERQLATGHAQGYVHDGAADEWGREITEYEVRTRRLRAEESNIQKREKGYERDYQDLLEYVHWISGDLSMLRDRARISDKIISDLKSSGEESVDKIMSTLSHHKHKQDALDRDVDGLRSIITGKEGEIAVKESDITNLKRLIELETNEKEIEIRRIKTEIEEQGKVIENQQKIIKELQVLNDYTQNDLIQATSELQTRIKERNDLQLRFLDSDHETANMHFKQMTLEEQAVKLSNQIQQMQSNSNL